MTDLTLDTFKSDIQHFFIRYGDAAERNLHIENLINEHYAHIKDECNAYLTAKTNEGVHRTHCCVKHGCKYSADDYCPVVNKEVEQKYLCEDCGYDGITQLSQLYSTDHMNISRINAKGNSCNFCDRGIISDNGINLTFPYDDVTLIETKGNGVSIRMCDDCIRELNEKIKIL